MARGWVIEHGKGNGAHGKRAKGEREVVLWQGEGPIGVGDGSWGKWNGDMVEYTE